MAATWYSENGKRAFRGTDYFLAGTYKTKAEAQSHQKQFRGRYWGSRVTKEKVPYDTPQIRYIVWVRTKH